MAFSHENLAVYVRALEFVRWSQSLLVSLPATAARDQLDRASVSIPLNIAEGNVKASRRDRARFWQIALGSTMECAAVLDVVVAKGMKTTNDVEIGKGLLHQIVAMLMTMIRNLGTTIREEGEEYEGGEGGLAECKKIGDEDEDRR